MSGIESLKAARTAGALVPVLVITACDSLDDRIAGLDLGADDYIVKPFELRELLARMRAVMRGHNGQAQSLLMSGEITLDLVTHQARHRNTEHTLSAREFALMHAFMQRPGGVLPREQMQPRIYGC